MWHKWYSRWFKEKYSWINITGWTGLECIVYDYNILCKDRFSCIVIRKGEDNIITGLNCFLSNLCRSSYFVMTPHSTQFCGISAYASMHTMLQNCAKRVVMYKSLVCGISAYASMHTMQQNCAKRVVMYKSFDWGISA